jgi:hypothetical protein
MQQNTSVGTIAPHRKENRGMVRLGRNRGFYVGPMQQCFEFCARENRETCEKPAFRVKKLQ